MKSNIEEQISIQEIFTDKYLDSLKTMGDSHFYKKEVISFFKLLNKQIKENKEIILYGDFDADGITATTQLFHHLCMRYGLTPLDELRNPTKIKVIYNLKSTDGYEPQIYKLEEVNPSKDALLIFLDVGIKLSEGMVLKMKEMVSTIMVIDHHHPKYIRNDKKEIIGFDIAPSIDFVIDLQVSRRDGEFNTYCTAGLIFKLLELLLVPFQNKEGKLIPDYSVQEFQREYIDFYQPLAAIGTVADMVPNVYGNSFLIYEGLTKSNNSYLGRELVNFLGNEPRKLSSGKIGYTIAAAINSLSRINESAKVAMFALLGDTNEMSKVLVSNETKKDLLEIANKNKECKIDNDVYCIYKIPTKTAGYTGLLGNQLNGKKTAVVYSQRESGTFVGSFRSISREHHADDMVSSILNDLDNRFSGGGHALAAGWSFLGTEEELLDLLIIGMSDWKKSKTEKNIVNIKELTYPDIKFLRENVYNIPIGEQSGMPLLNLPIRSENLGKVIELNRSFISYNVKVDQNTRAFQLFGKDINNFVPEQISKNEPLLCSFNIDYNHNYANITFSPQDIK